MNIRRTLFLIILTSTMLMKANAQVAGKTFEGSVRYVCKKMAGGGCAITTFCVLQFSEKTVDVYHYAKASCTPAEREADYSYDNRDKRETYKWSQSDRVITIKGFEEYGTFVLQDNKLISSQEGDEGRGIEFAEKHEE